MFIAKMIAQAALSCVACLLSSRQRQSCSMSCLIHCADDEQQCAKQSHLSAVALTFTTAVQRSQERHRVFGQFLQLGNSTALDSADATANSSSSSSGDTTNGSSSSSSSSVKKKVATFGQPSGTGLGLSLCLRFVQRMNGHIWATNLPPRCVSSTTLHFTITRFCVCSKR
jgi:hypothetical protein